MGAMVVGPPSQYRPTVPGGQEGRVMGGPRVRCELEILEQEAMAPSLLPMVLGASVIKITKSSEGQHRIV